MAAHDHAIVVAILVAAGSGSRLGAAVPKAFVPVAGRTLLEHAATRFAAHPQVDEIVLAAPGDYIEQARELVPDATVVAGGTTRQESVARALAAVSPGAELVLVHDVARAFVPSAVITRVIAALESAEITADAVVPTVPVSDTIRQFSPDSGELGALVDRSRLRAMQTPQGFRREILVEAHMRATGSDATDDAALVEALGIRVHSVEGDERAFKVTLPLDLALAEVVARG